jgi:hypothetical protein
MNPISEKIEKFLNETNNDVLRKYTKGEHLIHITFNPRSKKVKEHESNTGTNKAMQRSFGHLVGQHIDAVHKDLTDSGFKIVSSGQTLK